MSPHTCLHSCPHARWPCLGLRRSLKAPISRINDVSARRLYASRNTATQSASTSRASSELAALVQQRRTQQAVELVDTILDKEEPLSTAPCSQLIRDLCTANKFETAMRLFRRIKGQRRLGSLSLPAYHILMQAAFKANQAAAGLEVFAEQMFRRRTASVQVYTTLISGLLKSTQRGVPSAQLAYEYWQQLLASRQVLDHAAYVAGLNACVEARRLDEARQLLGAMRAAGHPPDTRAHNIIMKAHARAGDADAARRLFREMRTYGYTPDLVTYNTLMQAFIAKGELVRARAVLDKARREGHSPDAYSYTALMRGHAAQGQAQEAGAVFREMIQDGVAPNVVTYGVIIDSYVEAGDVAAAQQIAQEAQSCGVRLNARCYNSLIKGYCRGGWESGGAVAVGKLLAEMGAAGVSPGADTYTTILDALLQTPDYAGAGALLSQMQRLGIQADTVALTCAMKLYVRNGEPDTALRLFDEMLLAAEDAAAAAEGLFQRTGDTAQNAPGYKAPNPGGAGPGGVAVAAGTRGDSSSSSSSGGVDGSSGNGSRSSDASSGGDSSSSGSSSNSGVNNSIHRKVSNSQLPSAILPNSTKSTDSSSIGGSNSSSTSTSSGDNSSSRSSTSSSNSSSSNSSSGMSSKRSSGNDGSSSSSSSSSGRSNPATASGAPTGHSALPGGLALYGPDVAAWNALVDVLVGCELMTEAEAAVQRAVEAAAAARLPVPVEAYGALIKGYKAREQQPQAVAALRQFLTLGGRPQRHMCDDVIRLCLRAGEFKVAAQVLRAMELTGIPVDRPHYQAWFRHYQQQEREPTSSYSDGGSRAGRRGSGSGAAGADAREAAGNLAMERLKWWLGLPNSYYSAVAEAEGASRGAQRESGRADDQ